jgi:hypothetical protein
MHPPTGQKLGQKVLKAELQETVSDSPLIFHVHLAGAHRALVQFRREALMQGPTACAQCDLPEERCTCERYCTICKGQLNVRLCSDGLYYCPDCREACDVSLATSRGH